MDNSVRRLTKKVNEVASLKESLLAVTDDSDTIRDTIEGATSLHELIAAVVDSIDEDELFLAGISKRLEDLTARMKRVDNRVSAKRAVIEQAMEMGEIKTLETPTCTLTLSKRPPKIIVVDESAIPTEYFKARDPALDKKALLEALRDGQKIPGATLSNPSMSLTIRRA